MSAISAIVDRLGQFGSSDFHLTSNRGAFYVKDKATRKIKDFNYDGGEMIELLINNVITGGMKAINEQLQGDASFDQDGAYRGRLAVRKEHGGLSCTMRIISRDIPTRKALGLPESVGGLIELPSGLVLIVGQTGSGKSTTIAAMNNDMNLTRSTSIYTLESPIEYVYPEGMALVVQREIGTHVESFPKGIENALRSHPAIINVGEILNTETARAALRAANSGHLVVSTMHAGTAAEAVDSFVSMFMPEEQGLIRTQLAQSLRAIVAQQLLPKPGGGMALAQEIAFNTPQFAGLLQGSGVRSNDTKLIQQLLLSAAGRQDGMVAMEDALALLVRDEQIAYATAHRAARDKKALDDALRILGVRVAVPGRV